jgi:hypothetical protein
VLVLGRADRQEGIDIAQKRFEAQQKINAAQDELNRKKYLAGLNLKALELALS